MTRSIHWQNELILLEASFMYIILVGHLKAEDSITETARPLTCLGVQLQRGSCEDNNYQHVEEMMVDPYTNNDDTVCKTAWP